MHWRRFQRMVCDNLCKLLQKQTYTFLSSRHGILLCFIAFLFSFISVIQFGEVALEWSVVRYQKTLFPHVDNILHKSFQERLCLPLPIDIVYTWVNGTDPWLLNQLAKLKSKMEQDLNDSISSENSTLQLATDTGIQKGKGGSGACPYKNCVALNTIILKVHTVIKIADLKKIDPVFLHASNMYNISAKSDPKSNSKNARLTVIKFLDENSLKHALDRSFTINGEKVVAQRAYYTSQATELAVRMRAMAFVSGNTRFNDNDNAFKDFLRSHFSTKLRALDYYDKEKLAVLTFKDDQSYQDAIKLKKGDLKFQRTSLLFEPVLMVWEPFPDMDLENYDNHFSASRFADNQELRYSLRSVEKFAPWVRQIFIVTNGQIPSWLNLDNPRIKIVTHADIFTNKSHLPTFSSPAIESHLHKIPGLSKKFIYLNDDVMFGEEVWPDDFYTHAKGQKVFLSWPVPNCNEGCPATWINDKYCDKACNVSECDWDGGDCLKNKIKVPQQWQSVISRMNKRKPQTFCNNGCANSWIGDRYCDTACNHPGCGFDAGDCGIKQFFKLHSEILHENSEIFHLPSGLEAMYFNLSEVYGEGKITEGEQDGSSILRSVTIAQKFKAMIITFNTNETMTSVNFRLAGFKRTNDTTLTEVRFNLTIETVGEPKHEITREVNDDVLVNHTNKTNASTTLYPITIYNAINLKQWDSQDAKLSAPTWPTVSAIEYCVPEIPSDTNVPEEVLKKIVELEEDLRIGDITKKGYNRKKARLIKEKFGITCGSDFQATTIRADMAYMKSMTKTAPSHEQTTKDPNDKAEDSIHRVSRRHLNKYEETDTENPGFLPWERQKVFKRIQDQKEQRLIEERYRTSFHQRSLLDAFSGSLLHVNRIYNRAFGYKARKVPSHMPHMVDVDILKELQAKFPDEFDTTSSNKLRSKNDMQFALSYFYYLIDETKEFDVSRVFGEVDADTSGTLSDRELRTLLTKFNEIPLKTDTIKKFLEQLRNCSRALDNATSASRLVSERQYGYDLPPITEDLLRECEPIMVQLNKTKKKESKFKHEIVGEDDIAFKMIKNNATHVLKQLDEIRKNKKKFICLNDNIEHDNVNASVVKGILVDFYESLFPTPSQFELPDNLKNRFLYVDELKLWKNEERRLDFISDSILMIVFMVILLFVFRSPTKHVGRLVVGLLKRRVRTPRMTNPTSTKLLTV